MAMCAALLLLCGARSRAQTSEDRATASKHFDRGIELVSEQAYAEAAAEFERAYELTGVVAILYNLGMAFAAANRPVEAASALERYLAQAGDSVLDAESALIDAELQRQRDRIGLVDLEIDPRGALVEIDGRAFGRAPLRDPVRLSVGEHRIDVSRPEYESAERVLTIAGGERARLNISLQRRDAPKPEPSAKLPIRCAVPDIEVYVDNVPAVRAGRMGPVLTTAGPHVVRFRRPGFAESSFRVQLPAGMAPPIDCALRALRQPPATVAAKLEVQLSGTTGSARLNGAPLPESGVVPYGRHRFEVSGADFEPFSQELTLSPGETRKLQLALAAEPSAITAAEQRTVAYIFGAAGLGFGIAALTVYLDADGKYDTWTREDKALTQAVESTPAGMTELAERQQSNDDRLESIWAMDRSATVLAISSAVLLTVGGVVFFTASDAKREVPRRLELSVSGGGARLSLAL